MTPLADAPDDPRRPPLGGSPVGASSAIEGDGGLQVAEPRPAGAWWPALLLIAALGVALFLILNSRRQHLAAPAFPPATANAPGAPAAIPELPADLGLADSRQPPPTPPPAPVPAPLPMSPLPSPLPLAPPPQAASANTNTPVLVVDFGPQAGASSNRLSSAGAPAPGRAPAGTGLASDAGGLESLALGGAGEDGERVTATRLSDPSHVVPRGAVIPAVLETAIDSDLPGYARAVVSRDVLSFDGANVLIPRGSRLIGQYKSDLAPGQSRVFVVWTSVTRPDGASINLASPGADDLGRGGLKGTVDRRFLERYGGAILLTTLNASLNALSAARSQIMIAGGGIGIGAPAATSGGKPIGPVVKVPQGARIRVFVARELDFSTVGGVPLKPGAPTP